jgi:hypothetical protein
VSGLAEMWGPPSPWAVFSPCERYRYVLAWPTGLAGDRYALFVLANPSTATAEQTDPTVARCIGYARRWGYGWARVVNVRAWRETDPKKVPADPLAIGPENRHHITHQVRGAGVVVCGWGKLGGAQGEEALAIIRAAGAMPHALRLNMDGTPSHPLYLPSAAELIPMGAP